MIDIVVTLVFSIVMLMFMAYPAIKIVDFIESKKELSIKVKNSLTLILTILLSLLVGLFLKLY